MYLESIDGLNIAIQETPLYKSKRPSEKPILIDRCNFVINSIIQGNRHHWSLEDYGAVPLHRDILVSQLGARQYIDVLSLLKEADYIDVNDSYLSQTMAKKLNAKRVAVGLLPNVVAESKKYSLTAKSKEIGIAKVGVLSERSVKRFLKHKAKLINHYLKDTKVHSKIFNSISNLHFNYIDAENIRNKYIEGNANKDQAEFYDKSYKALKQINDYTTTNEFISSEHFYYTQSKKVDRVFHYYGNIPKNYRKHLSHKNGNKLAEIDLKNSQPFIITMAYIKELIANNKTQFYTNGLPQIDVVGPEGVDDRSIINKERNSIGSICVAKSISDTTSKLLKEVLSGTLYRTVAEYALLKGDKEFYDLYIKEYGKFKAKVLGEGLYFNYVPLKKIKPAEQYLRELYPDFMQWIRTNKQKNGYKSISIEAQKIESSLFINDLFTSLDAGAFAVPVHDSIIVKAGEVQYFKQKLFNIFAKQYPMLNVNIVKDLFKVEYYG